MDTTYLSYGVDPTKLLGDMTVQQVELTLRDYCVAALIDAGVEQPNVRAFVNYKLEYLAHLLQAVVRLPTHEQQDRVIAEYPDGLWQHIKAALGLQHRTVKVWFNETLIFPKIPAPLRALKTVIVPHTEIRRTTRND